MNLAGLLAENKMFEQQLIRIFVSRKNIMNRNYINISELTITENNQERNKFENDRNDNIIQKDLLTILKKDIL